MNKIFVVMGSEGSYDDYTEWMIRGFKTQARAEAHIELCQVQDERFNLDYPELRTRFLEWVTANPQPISEPYEPQPRMQKGWKSWDIPEEFKREQARIQRDNEARELRWRAADEAWKQLAHQTCLQLLSDLAVPAEEHATYLGGEYLTLPWHMQVRDNGYEIQELEVDDE